MQRCVPRPSIPTKHHLLYSKLLSTKTHLSPLPSRNPSPSTSKLHHTPTGFTNPWPSYTPIDWISALTARFGSHPQKNFIPIPSLPSGLRSHELVKVLPPTWGVDHPSTLRATWLGHASFLIELPVQKGAERGVRVLLDPVFSERTSPVSWAGPKRYTGVPCGIEEVPSVDVVCVSHSHYDHLDVGVMRALVGRDRGEGRVKFVVPLGLREWFTREVLVPANQGVEMDWWDAQKVVVDGVGSVEVTCVPAQHTSGRSVWDQMQSLWCGFCITSAGKTVYFAGDTAYQSPNTPSPCPIFPQIRQAFPSIDLALLPIGLMSPPSLLGSVHATPEQSMSIHEEVGARVSLGMHYGTVRGGVSAVFEDVREPGRRWREEAERRRCWLGGGVEGKVEGEKVDVREGRRGVGLCHVGETVCI